MSSKNCGICMEALGTELDLPLCRGCRYRFHFGKCSGIDSASWPKRGTESKKKWTCHICDPSKNLSKSKSGVFTPSELAEVSGTTSTQDDALLQLQPEPMPTFSTVDEKLTYILSQIAMLVQQNATVLRELQKSRQETADAKRMAVVNAVKVDRLEEQVRIGNRRISDLEYKNRSLEDYSRVDNVIVHGLPHPKSSDEAFEIALAVGKAVGVDIKHHNLSACHALGRPQNGVGRIVCRFTQRWMRNSFHNAINEKKITTSQLELEFEISGEPTKIYATDHNSPQTSHLYSEAKRLLSARQGGAFQQVYMRSRKIYARRFDGDAAVELRSIEHVRSLAGQTEQIVNGAGNRQSDGL